MSDSIVSLRHVEKWYGNNHVVKDMNLEIQEGEFLTLLGPSGCGKTTTLRMIAGFENATSGTIEVQGQRVEEKEPYERDVNTVFQNYSLFPHMTVFENVAFGLKMKRKSKAEIDQAVAEVLELVGLTKYKDYYPVELSTSMLQRVVIARAFAVKPDILLMDEPYGQLDVELRFRLEDELIKLWQKLGTTVIFITHNIEEAVYLSENILVLTNKPTSIKRRLDNPLPRPRNVVAPSFIDLRNQVTELIKWW